MQQIEKMKEWYGPANALADIQTLHGCYGPQGTGSNALAVRLNIEPLLATMDGYLDELAFILNPTDEWMQEEVAMLETHRASRQKRLTEAGIQNDIDLRTAKAVLERTGPKDRQMLERLFHWSIAVAPLF